MVVDLQAWSQTCLLLPSKTRKMLPCGRKHHELPFLGVVPVMASTFVTLGVQQQHMSEDD